MKKVGRILQGVILYLVLGMSLVAQETFVIDSVQFNVIGTSTLHDWKVVAPDVTEYPRSIEVSNIESRTIEEFGFKIEVASMDGGRGSAMNKKIYKALLSDIHPYISYRQLEPAVYTIVSSNIMNITSRGILNIAGVEKEHTISFKGYLNDTKLKLSGEYPLSMSDFNIEPPSAMFGQIQTKDEIVVQFNFIYKKKS